MKIALVQLDMGFENKDMAKQRCVEMMEKANKQCADLIVFPEMTLTGFTMQTGIYGEQKQNSETVAYFQNAAKKYSMGIVFGVIFLENGRAENHSIILDKKGKIQADYAKIHPFSYGAEAKYYVGGNEIVYCEMEGMTISPFVCYDLRFPEIFQVASKKSHCMTVIANWPKQRIAHWKILLQARAIETQSFIVGVNRSGKDKTLEYSGDSMLVAPTGEILAHLTEQNDLQVVEIDIHQAKQCRQEFPVKADRKEMLYGKWLLE